MKQIAILGSTGSIGTQALQVIEEHPDQYEAYVLTANNRVEELIAQARKFKPEAVVIANESKYTQLKEALADLPIKVYAGADALCQIVTENPIDMVLTAMVGYAGLKPTMNAIRARKPIALANKRRWWWRESSSMTWHASAVSPSCPSTPSTPPFSSAWPAR